MKSIMNARNIMILLAALILSGCIKEASLQYGDLVLGAEYEKGIGVEPVMGQGMRLKSSVSNLPADYEEMGFVVNTGKVKYPFIDDFSNKSTTIKVDSPENFETLVVRSHPLVQDYYAYAYIKVGGLEFRSDIIEFSIPEDIAPDPTATIFSAEAKVMPEWSYYVSLSGLITVRGEGFFPFGNYDRYDKIFQSEYLKINGENIDVQFDYASENVLRLRFNCNEFATYNLTYHQGSNVISIPDVVVQSPDTILSPGRKLRTREPWHVQYANGEGQWYLNLKSENQDCGIMRLDNGDSYSFTPQSERVKLLQYYNGFDNHCPINLEFSFPWQLEKTVSGGVWNESYAPFICSEGTLWTADGYSLYSFNGTGFTSKGLPKNYTQTSHKSFLPTDDGSIVVRYIEELAWNKYSVNVIRYWPQTKNVETLLSIKSTDKSYWNMGYVDNGHLVQYYFVSDAHGYTVYGREDIDLSTNNTTTTNVDDYSFGDMIGRKGDIIYCFTSRYENGANRHYILKYNVKTGQKSYIQQRQLDCDETGVDYLYLSKVLCGDWLYLNLDKGSTAMRLNVERENAQVEYLGAPLGMHDNMQLLPLESDCYSLCGKKLYKFVQDR